jgi:uncharacterized delta-60 repeat protein
LIRTTLRLQHLEDRTAPAAGGLDPFFGTNGLQTIDFGGDDQATAVAIQPDLKTVVVGTAGDDFAVARLHAGGALDTSFGAGGKAIYPMGAIEKATSVALQDDGKIVVAGYTNLTGAGPNDFAVIRTNTNGVLDTSFGTGGIVWIDFGFDDRANAVLVQPDGKIVVVGQADAGSSNFAIARLLPDGTLDGSFAGFGKTHFSFNAFGSVERATAVVLQSDGKIVIAGYSDAASAGSNDFAVARLTKLGLLDPTFHNDGKLTIDLGGHDWASGVAVQPDGKIVVCGTETLSASFAVARINPNGTLDPTFGSDGRLSIDFGGGDWSRAIALQPGGKIILAGYTSGAAGLNFAMARVNPNGTADNAFGFQGKSVIDFGGGVDLGYAMALRPDARIIVAGLTNTTGAGPYDFAVARLIGANVEFQAIGGEPGRVEVFAKSGASLGSFLPYQGYTAGVAVALGDVDSDGIDDLITSATIGNPHTKVYDGAAIDNGTFFSDPEVHVLAQGFPYAINFNVGANVAAGDINGDGYEDLITGAVPGNPHVRVYDGKAIVTNSVIPTATDASVLAEGFAYGINFNVGANVAAGDVNGDGFADVITGATAGNPHTKVYNAQAILATRVIPTNTDASELAQFFPYALQFNVGAFVSAADYNRDGFADIVTGASIGNPEVRVFSGKHIANGTFDMAASLLDFYFAFEQGQNIGAAVAASDLTADGKADVLVGTRGGAPRHRIFKSNLPDPSIMLVDVNDAAFAGNTYVAA